MWRTSCSCDMSQCPLAAAKGGYMLQVGGILFVIVLTQAGMSVLCMTHPRILSRPMSRPLPTKLWFT
jgi:hypothetical protein